MCKCGFKNLNNAKFCSNCGIKIEIENDNKYSVLPQMLTVKDVHEQVFMKKVSLAMIYTLIRTRSIPHCKINGRLLLDKDKTIDWWNKKLNESVIPVKLAGLRKIL